jgi:transketolase
MRITVIKSLYEAGLRDKNIYFITGDLQHPNYEEFKANWGPRYINAGMAEQNIVSMAAGLALSGKKVFVFSIIPFITLRCIEQIKVDVCDMNLDVTVLGAGSGFIYGTCGATHLAIEDVAALRAFPNLRIVAPAGPWEAKELLGQIIRTGGPTYLRLNKYGEPDPDVKYEVALGRAAVMREGKDVTIIGMGTIVNEALVAADELAKRGVSAEVVHMHTVKPIDADFIRARAKDRKAIFTLEEHNVLGGLGGAVAEVLAECPERPRFKRFGVADAWPEVVGSQQYLRGVVGLTGDKIAEEIARVVA